MTATFSAALATLLALPVLAHAQQSPEEWHLDLAKGGNGVDIETTNGSVEVAVPLGVGAAIEASTRNGGIDFDFPVQVQGRMRRQVTATIGEVGRPTGSPPPTEGSPSVGCNLGAGPVARRPRWAPFAFSGGNAATAWPSAMPCSGLGSPPGGCGSRNITVR